MIELFAFVLLAVRTDLQFDSILDHSGLCRNGRLRNVRSWPGENENESAYLFHLWTFDVKRAM